MNHWAAIQQEEIVVLLADECHLVWGDVCGKVWGKRNTPIPVPITNERQRQTYYGAINLITRASHLQAYPAGKGECTVDYLRWLRDLYPHKPIILLWDGATYHRDAQVKAFLAEVNADHKEAEWQLTCIRFAPNAPEQNPIEDIWLQGKNHLRKNFSLNKTFAAVKHCFSHFLQSLVFDSIKFSWYTPCT